MQSTIRTASSVMSPGPSAELVRSERSGRVGIVTFARPDRLNALTSASFEQLRDRLLELGRDSECRAIVLTGEGRSFCAGMDVETGLAGIGSDDPILNNVAAVRAGVEAVNALRGVPQPVIAAVHGHAVGVGFALAAAADLRVAAPDARFSAPFGPLGLSAGDLGLSWTLPRIVGSARATGILLTAKVVDAAEAERIGLVQEVADHPLIRARELAATIAGLPGYGVVATKELLTSSWTAAFRDHTIDEGRAQVIALTTQEHLTARAAMTERIQRKM